MFDQKFHFQHVCISTNANGTAFSKDGIYPHFKFKPNFFEWKAIQNSVEMSVPQVWGKSNFNNPIKINKWINKKQTKNNRQINGQEANKHVEYYAEVLVTRVERCRKLTKLSLWFDLMSLSTQSQVGEQFCEYAFVCGRRRAYEKFPTRQRLSVRGHTATGKRTTGLVKKTTRLSWWERATVRYGALYSYISHSYSLRDAGREGRVLWFAG